MLEEREAFIVDCGDERFGIALCDGAEHLVVDEAGRIGEPDHAAQDLAAATDARVHTVVEDAVVDASREVITVGDLVGVPDGGNPHRWYSPADVGKVADAITADLKKLDPAAAAYFESQRKNLDTVALARYHAIIADIRARYAGTPVGASESIFPPLSQALGLKLLTPDSFMKAISEGTDPSVQDKATIDDQISGKKIDVYVFNSQNATPDVAAQVAAAKAEGIPVVAVTETLSPATAGFQDWQVAQLKQLEAALEQGTGR